MPDLRLRPAGPDELPLLAGLWFDSARDAHDYLPQLQALEFEQGCAVFLEQIAPGLELHVCESGGAVQGLLGLDEDLLDRLYVAPAAQGRGLGSALLAHARTLRPDGLRLFTHQKNRRARDFYEARGFHARRFGMSPAPEWEPDVLYVWRPGEV